MPRLQESGSNGVAPRSDPAGPSNWPAISRPAFRTGQPTPRVPRSEPAGGLAPKITWCDSDDVHGAEAPR